MSILRSYFSKDNAIITRSQINTGRNPIVEIFNSGGFDACGGTFYSRYLFQINLDDLQADVNQYGTCLLDGTKHELTLFNTSCFDIDPSGEFGCCRERATSFELILFRIPEAWDEGIGSYQPCDKSVECIVGNKDTDICGSSNWYDRQQGYNWSEPGVYSGDPTTHSIFGDLVIDRLHFDRGNENFKMDITNVINDILTGNTPNYGFGIAFDRGREEMLNCNATSTGFFGRETQTFFEPYLETRFDDVIKDDRAKFQLDKNNKIYLYVNAGGKPTQLDNLPDVNIFDHEGTLFSAMTATCVTKGVYCVELMVPSTYPGCITFNDVWSGLTINGMNRGPIEMDIVIDCDGDYFNIGNNECKLDDVALSLSGIKQEERLIPGDIRKVLVSARKPFTTNENVFVDCAYYRMYTTEGPHQITVIDWEEISRSYNENYFLIDTNWLLPGTYYLDVKVVVGHDVKITKDVKKFVVVGQSEIC